MHKLIVILLLACSLPAFSQQVTVANLNENIVMCGVDNPLSAAVAGYPACSIVLTTTNGKITKQSCGYFTYRPAETGPAIIKVWVKNGRKLKLAGKILYRIHALPLPVAFIGTYSGEEINLNLLKALRGISARLINSDFDISFQITSYTATGTRDNSTIFTIKNTGARYSDTLTARLNDLRNGDHFTITNIACTGPDEKEMTLTPLEFIIKD